ncbi:unnamed protein product [Rotaria sp. Silwood1]|nr:unnamed protein product [Rotaria sp. Silwood1]CAF1382168.1 unnamed protein product [Rotaria sp. Silwood1]CAF1657181.1 unnamed protein product [Rotaria sp. Silwood1]CAF1657196.1 unnamed protein product [Rotaria sp. Silwood1]CAF3836517.1 unnamed protein product [Rotaria sp. Silwood1]
MDDYISDSDDLWITIEELDENNENNNSQLQNTKKRTMDVFLELENKIDKHMVQVNDNITKLAEEIKSMNKSLYEHICESVRQQKSMNESLATIVDILVKNSKQS